MPLLSALLQTPNPMSDPLVSIVIPAYNSEKFIAETLESVFAQTYQIFEIIVVDDGSTDKTVEIIQSYGNKIRLYQQANKGPGAARNLGVSMAKGELLAFVDSDDIWVKDKLAQQVHRFRENPDLAILCGDFKRWNQRDDGGFDPLPADETAEEIHFDTKGWNYAALLLDSEVWICTVMLRKSAWLILGGMDEAFRIGEDWDFFIRASRQFEIKKLNKVLAFYRIHHTSITHKPLLENFAYRVVSKAIQTYGTKGPDGSTVDERKLKEALFGIRLNHALLHFKQGSPNVAVSEFVGALTYKPWKLKIWFFLFISFSKTLLKI